MIEAHAIIGLLSNIGVSQFHERKNYISQLKEFDLFPLSIEHATKKARRKIRLANIHSLFLVWLLHLLNK